MERVGVSNSPASACSISTPPARSAAGVIISTIVCGSPTAARSCISSDVRVFSIQQRQSVISKSFTQRSNRPPQGQKRNQVFGAPFKDLTAERYGFPGLDNARSATYILPGRYLLGNEGAVLSDVTR